MVFHEALYRYQGDGYLKARECSGGANDIHTPHSDLLSASYPKIIMEKGQPVVLHVGRLVLPFHMSVLARVDLYDTGTKIYFGEMTLTPAGAIFHNWSQKALDDMGSFYYKTMKK